MELLVERQHRLRLLQDFRVVNLLVHTIPFQLLFQACYVLPAFKSAPTHRPRIIARTLLCVIHCAHRPRIPARTTLCAIHSLSSSGVEHNTVSWHLLVLDRFLLERCQVLHSRAVLAGLAPCLLLATQLYRNQLLFKAFALGQTGLE